MATNVVFLSLASILGLGLCFAGYSIKRKPYLYVRNVVIVAFGTLFLLTLLLTSSHIPKESLKGCGFNALFSRLLQTQAWWEILLKLLVPLIVALTTIFLAELPRRGYETVSATLMAVPLTCGLYVTPNVGQGVFILLVVVYTIALFAVGLFMFRTYLCVETAAVGGFLTAYAIKTFYKLSSVSMFIIAGLLTLLGATLGLILASRKDKNTSNIGDNIQ